MRKFFPLFLAAIALLLSGCAPTTHTVDGVKCTALTDRQVAELVARTRTALKSCIKKRQITPAEAAFALHNQPEIDIRYRGDRFGTAFITWRTKTRVVGMRFENELDARMPSCALITGPLPASEPVRPDKTLQGR